MTDPRDTDAALLAQSGRRAEAARLARPRKRELDPVQELIGLPPPVWLNDAGSKQPDGRCVLYSGEYRCPHPATHWVWIGCTLGEHLDKSATCGKHAENIRNYPVLHCKRCWDALREISDALIIKIELMDDEGTTPAPAPHPHLLP